ncbi:Coiled-coil domain-containing protein [Aphelenchoides fujianensis]|nr:Coiled-coil domain-containing protein [Aphelenchoides fujianensis]
MGTSEVEEDCETICETSISDSVVHNRYYREVDELDDESTTEYVALGQMSFSEWEKCERKRLEMLNEASDRATQMEKTMKWWADCTALWRRKWSLVRSERDGARNTIEKLMERLQDVQEDTLKYFEAKQEAEEQIRRMRAEILELRSRLGDSDEKNDEPIGDEQRKEACLV